MLPRTGGTSPSAGDRQLPKSLQSKSPRGLSLQDESALQQKQEQQEPEMQAHRDFIHNQAGGDNCDGPGSRSSNSHFDGAPVSNRLWTAEVLRRCVLGHTRSRLELGAPSAKMRIATPVPVRKYGLW